jgi:hypothetical protein
MLTNLFLPNGENRENRENRENIARNILDPSYNSIYYDSPNNQFIFEGFIRR